MSDQTAPTDFRRRLDMLAARRDWPALLEAARSEGATYPQAWEPAYHEGRAMLESGAYEPANQFLLQSMERFPTLPQFAVLYGYVGSRSLGAEAAQQRWEAMHARMPDAPGIRVGLSHAYRATGRWQQAEHVLAEGLQKLPDSVPLLVQYADLAGQRKEWDTAAQRWAAARARAPERLDLVVACIGALRQAGRLDAAEEMASQALRVFDPKDPDLNTSRASVAAARDDWALVAECLRRVLERAPDNAQACAGLVAALLRRNQTAEAERATAAGLERHPDNEFLLTEHAAIATRLERWNDALERWQAVYERCPARANTYLRYIEALIHNEKPDEAEVVSSEAVGFAPDDRSLLMQHANLATGRRDVKESAARWMALKRKFPEDQEIATGLVAARKLMMHETMQKVKDDVVTSRAPVRGSIRRVERPRGPPRLNQSEPSSLDKLMAGTVQPASATPPPRGLWRRLFGW